MPYAKMSEVNPSIRGVDPKVTLAQANYMATLADSMGDYEHAWPTAISVFKDQYEVEDDKWVKRKSCGSTGSLVKELSNGVTVCKECNTAYKADDYLGTDEYIVCAKCGGPLTVSAAKGYRQQLKDGDFLVIEKDADGEVTGRRLPITRVPGGKPNRNMSGAAWAALHKGYRGRKYAGPNKQKAITKLQNIYKANEWLLPSGNKELLNEYGMVCLRVPIDVAKQLVVSGGEDPADMHITLALLGKVEGMNSTQIEAAKDAVKRLAQGYPNEPMVVDGGHEPIAGKVDGYGIFVSTHLPGQEAVWAHFNSPYLQQFRESLCDSLRWRDVNVFKTNGFTPHITIAYKPLGQGHNVMANTNAILPIPVVFNSIQVVIGDDVYDYPFTKKGSKELKQSKIIHINVSTLR